ncbi:unnamed protein product [Ciceribacter sp. T2.26MG-112.2]|nr:unnamed protein product [Ciceribacter naphthalenivorans]
MLPQQVEFRDDEFKPDRTPAALECDSGVTDGDTTLHNKACATGAEPSALRPAPTGDRKRRGEALHLVDHGRARENHGSAKSLTS